jgi:hypothetical protein
MYYSYIEIEYVAMSFSPPRTDLAVKLLRPGDLEDTGFGGNGGGTLSPPPKKSGLGENLTLCALGRVFLKIYM